MAWTTEELAAFFEQMPDHPEAAAMRARKLVRQRIQKELEWLLELCADRRFPPDNPVAIAVEEAVGDEYGIIVNEAWPANPIKGGAND